LVACISIYEPAAEAGNKIVLFVSLFQFIYFHAQEGCFSLNVKVSCRGVQPCSTDGPNAHDQFGPRAATACVKLREFTVDLPQSLAWHNSKLFFS